MVFVWDTYDAIFLEVFLHDDGNGENQLCSNALSVLWLLNCLSSKNKNKMFLVEYYKMN